ncbi:unnamed protein product [Nippostrongylus brasiliensis]|uniref:Lipoprotein n=1 Tax=Nippostrongylus brasiliensis TaxID=27835 RepID=A0A0N4YRK4_NIPBR|nr:unnamed protein product [Nippostrongylus brasiliensis]
MTRLYFHLLLSAGLLYLASCQEPNITAECQSALDACENDLECQNRLAPLMAAWVHVGFDREMKEKKSRALKDINIRK